MKMMDHPNIIKLYEFFEDIRTGRRIQRGCALPRHCSSWILVDSKGRNNSHLKIRCSNIKMQVVTSQPLIQNKTQKNHEFFIFYITLPGEVLPWPSNRCLLQKYLPRHRALCRWGALWLDHRIQAFFRGPRSSDNGQCGFCWNLWQVQAAILMPQIIRSALRILGIHENPVPLWVVCSSFCAQGAIY